MSTSILWEPWKPKPRVLDVGHSGPFVKALLDAHVGHEGIYRMADLPTLRGMASVNSEFHQLVSAIEKYGEIRVWTES